MDDTANPVESIFAEALHQPGPAERAAFLAGACGRDARLRARVEGLLEAHDDAGSLMAPAADLFVAAAVDTAPGVDDIPFRLPSGPAREGPVLFMTTRIMTRSRTHAKGSPFLFFLHAISYARGHNSVACHFRS
jgi:hypothetical protein